jgi:hypothetical protein
MLNLAREDALDLSQVLETPGGFAWWYADLVDVQGRALVLIWSYGLPFLPGSRANPRPLERPSISLATYEGGRCSFYLLQTYARQEARLDDDGSMRLGSSRIRLSREGDDAILEAELDLPIPGGGRVTGQVRARGARCRIPCVGDEPSSQRWAPIMAAAEGRVQLAWQGGPGFRLTGRVYVDSNTSPVPLSGLHIAAWRWGRVALPERELIYYVLDSADARAPALQLVLEVLADGRLIRHRASSHWFGARRSVFGLQFHRGLRLSSASGLDVELRFTDVVDEGPFYLRFLVEATTRQGQRGVGVAELAAPEQVDRPWQRPFIRMRTHATDAPNSIWLPLFSGPAQGRARRLWEHWRPTRTAQGVAP